MISILLVEDDNNDVIIVEEAFHESTTAQILDVARDGEEAIQYLRQEGRFKKKSRPDMILLDINMPKRDGFQVLNEIKADQSLKTIPVVMLTTSDRPEDIATSYRRGASSYITKPVHFDQFSEIVKSFSAYWSSVASLPYKS